jgi:hypothetical protein
MSGTAANQEMRDLLIRLDEKVSNGFENINSKLDEMNRRADGHEDRIRKLEETSTHRSTYVGRFEAVEAKVSNHEGRFAQLDGAGKGVGLLGKVGTALLGAAIGVIGMLGLQIGVESKHPVKPATEQAQRPAK